MHHADFSPSRLFSGSDNHPYLAGKILDNTTQTNTGCKSGAGDNIMPACVT
jgi:hypothetical protein